MATKTKHDLKQTNTFFKLAGKVSGVQSKNFYEEKKMSNGHTLRVINFAVDTSTTNKVYVTLQGFERENVYFSKKLQKADSNATTDTKAETKAVSWNNRFNFNEDGFNMVGGVALGLKKTYNEKGALVNEKQTYTEYDACSTIRELLKDDMYVVVMGKKDVSSYTDKDGNQRVSVKLVPNKIYLSDSEEIKSEEEIDHNDLALVPNMFKDTIVYTGIEVDKESTSDNFSATITGYHIGYNDIVELDYKVKSQNIAKNFKTKLKPYSSIEVKGEIVNVAIIEEDNEDDGWGVADTSKKITNRVKEYLITRVEPSSINEKEYTQDAIDKAKIQLLEFNTDNTVAKTSAIPEIKDEDIWS